MTSNEQQSSSTSSAVFSKSCGVPSHSLLVELVSFQIFCELPLFLVGSYLVASDQFFVGPTKVERKLK